MKLLRDGVIKVVTPQIILNTRPFRDPFQENINRNKFQEVSNECLECKNDPENLEVQNSIQPTEEKHTQKIYNITKAVRKSKAITENEPLKFFNNIVKLNNKINNIGENKDFPRSEDISTAESHNTYEVTEDFGRPKIEVNQENNENKYVYPTALVYSLELRQYIANTLNKLLIELRHTRLALYGVG
ncbi:uncharacterized protein LOC128201459 [Galleria mellonella]|uniref:Uncharacterized protein LOC128201459 n=1 Tax=Galleria mellonella TaxID=7137 RepID=A0ABM3MSW1_GALME|nr:uncharacterized protein LOC128201459 [Galleria mellonella]